MYRRDLLKGIALTGASALLSSCAGRRVRASVPALSCMPRVNVSADRVIRTICGLRPFRPSGFVVRAEKFGETTVVHNYGHGGAGITLAWGTSRLALDLGLPGHTGPVAVLGAGVVGLSTARLLQESGFPVTIYTKELPPNTTSNIGGGWWMPVMVADHEFRTPAFNDQLAKASAYSFQRYQIMVGPRYGVRWTRSYNLNNEGFVAGRQELPESRDLQPGEHPFPGYKFVRQFDTLLIEPPIYLPAMLNDFYVAGGHIEVREIRDVAAVSQLPQKLVFNCTGLGAKTIFNDSELMPIKGQLTFLLPQSEVEYSVIPDDLYMFSRHDGVILGGTHERGNWSLDVDTAVRDRILARHKQFFDGMRSC